MREDEMIGWHHQIDGYEFEQAPGVGDGQGSMVHGNPWGHKELDTTKLNCGSSWCVMAPQLVHLKYCPFFFR